MTKNPYFSAFVAVAGALTLALPLITNAQTVIDTEAATGIGTSIDAGPNTGTMNLRNTLKQRIQQNYQNYSDNVKNNEDYRNTVMERRIGSTTGSGELGRPMPLRVRAEVELHREGTSTRPLPPGMMRDRFGSSTDDRDHGRAEMVHMRVFMQMRNHLVEQLNHALDNLKQIRGRVSARITLETQNGKDMTSASALLVTADAKILLADQAIQAIKIYSPTATTTAQASTTTDIELGKPREVGAGAIKAVNDARKALNDVVVAIAKSLGVSLRNDNHASSTDRQASSTHE